MQETSVKTRAILIKSANLRPAITPKHRLSQESPVNHQRYLILSKYSSHIHPTYIDFLGAAITGSFDKARYGTIRLILLISSDSRLCAAQVGNYHASEVRFFRRGLVTKKCHKNVTGSCDKIS